ncbi:MAG: HEAT repeat domain-containing protein, partial [Candidatus Omnitrophota bacterium]
SREMIAAREMNTALEAKGKSWTGVVIDTKKDAITWLLSVENNEKAIEPLLERLSDPDQSIRLEAAKAVCNLAMKIREPEKKVQAVETLERALFDPVASRDAEFRSIVAAALGNVEHEKAIRPLVVLLKDSVGYVRNSSILALRQLGGVLMWTPEEKKDELGYIIYTLTDLLRNKDRKIRKLAATALREIGAPFIMRDHLYSSFDLEKNENILDGHVLAAEKKWEDMQWLKEDAIPGLIGELNDEEVSSRENAAIKLGDAARGEINPTFKGQAVDELIKHLSDTDPGVIINAMRALGRIGDQRAVEHLKKIFNDSTVALVRMSSIEALAKIGLTLKKGSEERNNISKFVCETLSVQDPSIRTVAVNVLGELGAGDKWAPPAIIGCFYDPNIPVVKASAASLSKLGIEDEGIVELLIPELKTGSRFAKLASITVLDNLAKKGKVKEGPVKREAIKILLEYLSSNDEILRSDARIALSHLGATPGQFAVTDIRALESEFSDVKRSASSSLGRLGAGTELGPHERKDAVEALLKTLTTDPDGEVRTSAWEALMDLGTMTKYGKKQFARAYAKAVHNPDPQIRLIAVKALRGYASNTERPSIIAFALIEALEDEEVEIREEASTALYERSSNLEIALVEAETILYSNLYYGKIDVVAAGRKRFMDFLLEAMDSGPEVRRSAVQALGQIAGALEEDYESMESLAVSILEDHLEERPEDSEARDLIISALNDALKDEDEKVREYAAYELSQIADPGSVPALLEALGDRNDYVRQTAAFALGTIKDPKAVPFLTYVAKNDEAAQVRRAAVDALAGIDGREAASCLIEVFEGEDEQAEAVRNAAVNGLALMKDTKAWMYSSLLNHEDAWIVNLIEGKQTIYGLIEELKDKDPSVRLEVMRVLKEKAVDFAENILLSGETNPAAIKCWKILGEWIIYTLNRICDTGMKADISGDEEPETQKIWKTAEVVHALTRPEEKGEQAEGEIVEESEEEASNEQVRKLARETLTEIRSIFDENTEARKAIILALANDPQEIGEREEHSLIYDALKMKYVSDAADITVHRILELVRKLPKKRGTLHAFRREMIYELAEKLGSESEFQNEASIQLFERIEDDNVARFFRDLYRGEIGWVIEKVTPRDAAFLRGMLANTALNLCARIRRSASTVLEKVAPLLKVDEVKMRTVFPRLMEIFESDTDNDARKGAAKALGEIVVNLETAPKIRETLDEKIREMSEIFIAVLKDKTQDSKVRGEAAATLGRISPCIKRYQITQDGQQCQVTPSLIQGIFIQVLQGEASKDDRQDNLFKVMQAEEARETRVGLVRGIGHVGDLEGVPFLLDMLEKENDPEVRASIMLALGQIGISVREPDLFERIISALNGGLTDEHVGTRVNAVKGIGRLCRNFTEVSKDETPFLLKAIKDKDRHVRGAAATVLLRSGDRTVLDELYPDTNVLKAYEVVVKKRGDGAEAFTMTHLVTHLGVAGGLIDAIEEDRAVHLETPLIELGPSCIPALQAVFEEGLTDDPFILSASNVLSAVGVGDPRAVDIMIKGFPHANERGQLGIIQALSGLGGKEAVNFLSDIVKSDPDTNMRAMAALELNTSAECEDKPEILKSHFGDDCNDVLMAYSCAQVAKTNKMEELKHSSLIKVKENDLQNAKQQKRRAGIRKAEKEFVEERQKLSRSRDAVEKNRNLLIAFGENSVPAILPILSKKELDVILDLMLGILYEIGSEKEVIPLAEFLLSIKGKKVPVARKKTLDALVKFSPALKQARKKEEARAIGQSKWPRLKKFKLRLSRAAIKAKYRIGCLIEGLSIGEKPDRPKRYMRPVRSRLKYARKYLRWFFLRPLNRLSRRGTPMKKDAIRRDPIMFALDAVLRSGALMEDDKGEGENARKSAVKALEVLEATQKQVVNACIKTLKSDDAGVRKFAIELLGELAKGLDKKTSERKRATSALLDLLSDPDRGVRELADKWAGDLGATNEQLVNANVRALASPHKEAWLDAVKFFKMFKSRKAVKPMSRLLFDPEPENVMLVATVLGEIGDPSAINALSGALLNTAFPDVRKTITETIVKLSALTKSGVPRKAVSAVINLLPNWDEDTRENAKQTLADLGVDPERIAREITRANEKLVETQKLKLSLRERISRRLLRNKLGSKKAEKRKAAVNAFEKYAEYTYEDARDLVYMLYDGDVNVSMSAMDMLSRPAGIKALPYLIDGLSETESPDIHLMLVSILNSLAEYEDLRLTLGLALKPLIEQLSSKDEKVRQAAYDTILLVFSDAERVIGDFVYLLDNEDAGVRADAEKFLKDFVTQLGHDFPEVQSAITHMVDLLSEEDLALPLYETTIKGLRIMNVSPEVMLQAIGNAARNPDQNIWGTAMEDIAGSGLPGAKELLRTVAAEAQEDNLKRVTMIKTLQAMEAQETSQESGPGQDDRAVMNAGNIMEIIGDICSLASGNEQVCTKVEERLTMIASPEGSIHPKLQEEIVGLVSRPDLTPILYAATIKAMRIMNAAPEQLLGVMSVAVRNPDQNVWSSALNDIASPGISGAKELLEAMIAETQEGESKRAAITNALQEMQTRESGQEGESGQEPGSGQGTELNSFIILPLSGLSTGLGIALLITALCIKIWKLGKLDGEEQLPFFGRLGRGIGLGWQRLKLKSPWKGLRASAVKGLGIYSRGSKEVTISIIESLYDQKDVATVGLDVLKRLRSNKTALDLAAAVSDPEKDEWTAIRLALTELEVPTKRIAEGQIKVLSKCPLIGARASAVEFLAGVTSAGSVSQEEKDRIISALVNAIVSDRDLNVRRVTSQALDRLEVPAEDRVKRSIISRIYRAVAIARWGFNLRKLWKKSRIRAVKRLAKFAPDSREARITIIEALYDDLDVAMAALEVLGGLENNQVAQQLVEAVSDPGTDEWLTIRMALARLGTPVERMAEKQIWVLSKSPYSVARISVAEYLPGIALNQDIDPKLKDRIINALTDALGDSDSQVRTTATDALSRKLKVSDEILIKGFTKSLRSPYPDARKEAVIALGTIGLSHPKGSETRNRIIDILLDASENKKLDIQPVALSALYSLEPAGRQSVRCYAPALENDDMSIRRAAAIVLGNFGDKTAIKPLRKRLKKEANPNVRKAIQEALAQLGMVAKETMGQKPAPAAIAPVQPRAPTQAEEMAPLAKMLLGSKQQAASVEVEAEQVASTAFSGITKIVFDGKEVNLDHAMRKIREMASQRLIFNIRVEGDKISIGIANPNQRHPQIKDPKIGLGTFRCIIDMGEFSVVFDTYSGPMTKISQAEREEIARLYGAGYVRLARFFVENGFPASYPLGSSTKLVFRRLKLFQGIPQTIGDLARNPLEGDQKAAPAAAEQQAGSAEVQARQSVPTPVSGIKEVVVNGEKADLETAKKEIPKMVGKRLAFNVKIGGDKIFLGIAGFST